MKTCFTCKVEKPKSAFSVNKAKKDGLNSNCRSCMAARDAKWRAENLEKSNATVARYRANNGEKIRAYQKIWRAENSETHRLSTLAWRAANPERHKANGARWFSDNPEKARRYSAQQYAKHPEKAKIINARCYAARREEAQAVQAAYRAKYPDKLRAHMAKCRAARAKRVPQWLNDDDKRALFKCYQLSDVYTNLFGVPVHVDHILPLRGKKVSGLHVPWNLRIVLPVENLRKNALWSEIDAISKSLKFEDTVAPRISDLLNAKK